MRFFITESGRKQVGGSCYFEFQKGHEKKSYWMDDSLLLHMDIADEIALYKIIPDFKYYGDNRIDREKWGAILANAENAGGKAEDVINELCGWAGDNFKEFDHFMIFGI